jgi:hypothetical protein
MAVSCDTAGERMHSTAGHSIAAMLTSTVGFAGEQVLTMALPAAMLPVTELPERTVTLARVAASEHAAVSELTAIQGNAEPPERTAEELQRHIAMRERAPVRSADTAEAARRADTRREVVRA